MGHEASDIRRTNAAELHKLRIHVHTVGTTATTIAAAMAISKNQLQVWPNEFRIHYVI